MGKYLDLIRAVEPKQARCEAPASTTREPSLNHVHPAPDVIDLTLRRAGAVAPATTPVPPDIETLELPLCPKCQQRRFWLAKKGKVACSVCGRVIYQVTRLEFHSFA